jgi:hypothetical protein
MRLKRSCFSPLVFFIVSVTLSGCFLGGFIELVDNTSPVKTVPEGVKKWITMYVNNPRMEFQNLSGEKQFIGVNYHYEVIKGIGSLPSREFIYVIIKDAKNNTILRISTDYDKSTLLLSADDQYGTVEVNDKGEVIKSTPFLLGYLETLPAFELHGVQYENLIHFIAPNGVEFYYSQAEGLINFTVWRYGKMTEWFKI